MYTCENSGKPTERLKAGEKRLIHERVKYLKDM